MIPHLTHTDDYFLLKMSLEQLTLTFRPILFTKCICSEMVLFGDLLAIKIARATGKTNYMYSDIHEWKNLTLKYRNTRQHFTEMYRNTKSKTTVKCFNGK